MQHQFRGTDLTVTYDDDVCIHAAACVRALPSVFDADRTPWVSPDGAPPGEVRQTVAACPSGALRVFDATS